MIARSRGSKFARTSGGNFIAAARASSQNFLFAGARNARIQRISSRFLGTICKSLADLRISKMNESVVAIFSSASSARIRSRSPVASSNSQLRLRKFASFTGSLVSNKSKRTSGTRSLPYNFTSARYSGRSIRFIPRIGKTTAHARTSVGVMSFQSSSPMRLQTSVRHSYICIFGRFNSSDVFNPARSYFIKRFHASSRNSRTKPVWTRIFLSAFRYSGFVGFESRISIAATWRAGTRSVRLRDFSGSPAGVAAQPPIAARIVRETQAIPSVAVIRPRRHVSARFIGSL